MRVSHPAARGGGVSLRPERHVLVCTRVRAAETGMPSCRPNGGDHVLAALLEERNRRGLVRSVYVTETGCLGVCPEKGSTVVVYPEGVWYVGVTPGDVAEIVSEHLCHGRIVDRLRDSRFL